MAARIDQLQRLVNEQPSSSHRRARTRARSSNGSDNSEGSDESEESEDGQDAVGDVRRSGRKFVINHGVWLLDGQDTIGAKLDDTYKGDDDYKERFKNKHNRVQGQVREVIGVLPEAYVDQRGEKWVESAVR